MGNADDDLGLGGEGRALVDLQDEVLDHLFGHGEIGDDPVTITLQVSGYYDEMKNYGAL